MPQIIRIDTGQVIRIVNGEQTGYCCDSILDPITGKGIRIASQTSQIKDTFNFNDPNSMDQKAGLVDRVTLFTNMYPPLYETRIFIGNLPENKVVNYYCNHWSVIRLPFTYEVYETSNVWIEADICWNNQPALGNLLGEYANGSLNTWWGFPTGTTGAIAIRIKDGQDREVFMNFVSIQAGPSEKPYIS